MRAFFVQTDRMLRGTEAFSPLPGEAPARHVLPLMVLIFGSLYGAFMGTFHLDSPHRLLQVLYSGVKVPLLLFATSAVCLPGFFVLNTVLGLRDDLRAALRAILTGQAAFGVTLASLAPLTRFWYFSSDSYRAALLFNAGAFAVGALAGQMVMLRHYRPLIRRNRIHRVTLVAWLVLYAFVGMQMGWMLRPFIGSPNMPTTFFRQEPFTNAYVVILGLIAGR
jgi:hypothetical protein